MAIESFEAVSIALGGYWATICDGTSDGVRPFVEVYLLSDRQEPSIRATRITLRYKEFEVPPEAAAMVNMLDQGRIWAETWIESDMLKWYQGDGKGTALPAPVRLVRRESQVLAECWLRGKFQKEIRDISAVTRSTELEKLTRLVMSLSSISASSVLD